MFSQEVANELCERLTEGMTCRAACRLLGIPNSNVFLWLKTEPGFAEQYRRAREVGYEVMADEIIDISDESGFDVTMVEGVPRVDGEAIARAKLRTENRKWLLSKALPKVYGDKLDMTSKGEQIGFTIADAVAIAKAKQRTEDSAK